MKLRQAVLAWGLLVASAGSIVPAQVARLADGTAIRVRLTKDLLSSRAKVGSRVDMEIAQPVLLHGVVVIPPGSMAWGAVQAAKKGKTLRFDIEGFRLPNQQIVKLRVSAVKTTNAGKNEINVITHVGSDLGAAKGSEYVAYLNQDVNVEVAGAPAPPAPVGASQSSTQPMEPPPTAVVVPVTAPPIVAPTPETVAPAIPQPETPTEPSAPVSAPPAVAPAPATVAPAAPQPETPTAPPAPAPASPVVTPLVAPPARPAPPLLPVARPTGLVTVECFSDPSGAEITIDGEFHGTTPSILKLPPGDHQIEFRLRGYNPHSQPLNLAAGAGLHTLRMTLEKKP